MIPDEWQKLKIEDALERVSKQVEVEDNQTYNQIGIRSHCKGIFHKEAVDGKTLGNKRVFHIVDNCFIVNIVFAWEQAVAKTSSKELGMIASHRFPMFKPKSNICDIDYILYLFKTKYGKYLLGLASPGGAGRNKTLGQKEFSRLELALPPLPEQKKIAEILGTWDKAIDKINSLIQNSKDTKKSLMQQLLTGKKRLPGFSGEWKYLTFQESFKVANKKSTQIKSSDYLKYGSIPIVDQGKKIIAGYCNKKEFYNDIPVIVFGDHTRCLKWINFPFCPGADGTQVLKTRPLVDERFGYHELCHTHLPSLGYSRHMRELKEKEFKIPTDLSEQKSIATILSKQDEEISTLESQRDKIILEKKSLMQQLLSGKKRVKVEV